MLFSKYANPFILLDQMISCCRFLEFIDEFIDLENERTEYEYWLHKVWDKPFNEFQKSIERTQEVNFNEVDLETTINDSRNILSNFVPQ